MSKIISASCFMLFLAFISFSSSICLADSTVVKVDSPNGQVRTTLSLRPHLFASPVHGQFIRGYGVKAGAALANQTVDSGIYSSSYWGFSVSGYAEFFRVPVFSVVTEINFVQKGVSYTGVFTAASPFGTFNYEAVKSRLIYLGVPFLAKFRLDSEELLFAAPYLAFGSRLDFLIEDQGRGFYKDFYTETSPPLSTSAVFGGMAVLSFELRGLALPALFEIRYSANFSDIAAGQSSNVKSIQVNVLEFMIGVQL